MLDERSQNLMLAAIDDDIDVAQLEEELAELHGAAPDGGEYWRGDAAGARAAARRAAAEQAGGVPGPAAGGEPAL